MLFGLRLLICLIFWLSVELVWLVRSCLVSVVVWFVLEGVSLFV